ncbi:unnamed protein product [Dibothriocephalus latus]|uniref:Dynein light chain n=1 Tax=Dibothriocephalus latus TaxID=60516 RepID=A0A3P7LNU4_DIBLA|nr:unnamed protein product [Dibothriocephalus latus]
MRVEETPCICLKKDPGACDEKPYFINKEINEKLESFFLEIVVRAWNSYEDDELKLCTSIKQCLDQKFGPQWHVIVGEKFGSHFEAEANSFAYVKYKGRCFLMFRFG